MRHLLLFAASFFACCSIADATQVRQPDLETPPDRAPLSLVGSDNKGRLFQFYGRSFALLIGESDYEARPALKEVTTELRDLVPVLERQGFEVSLYLGLKSDELQPVIDDYFKQHGYQQDARLLFIFSGHGDTRTVTSPTNPEAPTQTVGYVLPIDIPKDTNGHEFIMKALPLSQFIEWANEIEVKSALFIFDSCFSGSILKGRRGDEVAARLSTYAFSDTANQRVREFLTAGSEKQTVPSKSVFMELFKQVLLGRRPEADVHGDGYLTGSELIEFMKGAVSAANPSQTPLSGRVANPDLNGGEFIFALRNAGSGQKVSSGPYMPVLLKHSFGAAPKGTSTFQLEASVITGRLEDCTGDCNKSEAKPYSLAVKVPADSPQPAHLENPTLICTSGACDNFIKIITDPTVTSEGQVATVAFETSGPPATWTLQTRLDLPLGIKPPPTITEDPTYFRILANISSADPELGALAQRQLRDMVEQGGPHGSTTAIVMLLDKDINDDGRRRILSVMSAVKGGWGFDDEMDSVIVNGMWHILKQVPGPLAKEYDAAARNMNFWVHYEVSPNERWLTDNGRIRPIEATKPPLPQASQIKEGQVLVADSEQNIRAGPNIEVQQIGVLKSGDCIVVVSPPPTREGTFSTWLKARQVACPDSVRKISHQ
jgi:hypothetical protein